VKPAAGAALPPAGGNAPPVARPAPAAGSVPAVPAAAVPAAAGAIVQFVAREDAWIEVVSGDNQRFNRLLRAGEQLALRGTPPFRLVVGNAANVQVAYRGKAVDLAPHIGDKVARVTLE
jgi:cytoskeleton protein RodZ